MSYTDYDSEVEYYSRIGGWLSDNDSTNESSERGKKDKEKEDEDNIFTKINNLIIKGNEFIMSHIIESLIIESLIIESENTNKRKFDDNKYSGIKKKKI